jgi:uncharacterized LabA/DUF88 family protein
MSFNIAIFYDIENLLKGYNFSQELISNLSLKEIVNLISETNKLEKIAVQRAYANWSDPRLSSMRNEINELGIDPIQVFGFSRDHKKNAADIQLAIDAIDIAHIRPNIEVYVIVSGDGGFAALAKKLHEYGKTVIACAYPNMSNRILKAVCDEFIPLLDPETINPERQNSKIIETNKYQVNDPKVVRLIPKIRELMINYPDDRIALTKALLRLFAEDTNLRRIMMDGGIYLSTIREAVRYAIPDFQQSNFGFPKFTEFLQYVCKDTPLCLVRPEHSSVFLTTKNSVPDGIEVLPELDAEYLHSPSHYCSILATGHPMFRLTSPYAFKKIAEWISQNSLQEIFFGTAIDNITASLNTGSDNLDCLDSEAVKLSILCFASANIFEQTPEGVPISEQKLTLKENYSTSDNILSALHNAIYNKLASSISPVKEEIIAEILSSKNDEELDNQTYICSNQN